MLEPKKKIKEDDSQLKEAFSLFSLDEEEESVEPFLFNTQNVDKSQKISHEKKTPRNNNHTFSKSPSIPQQQLSLSTTFPDLTFWKRNPPLHFGSLELVTTNMSGIGSKRGYVATQDIPAGTLLIREKSLVSYPLTFSNELFVIRILRKLLENPNSKPLLHSLKYFHPISLKEISSSILKEYRSKYAKDILEILDEYKNLEFQQDEMLQLLLVIKYNGVNNNNFLPYISIFNHSCQSNCVKVNVIDQSNHFDVRTTRDVKKGEKLCVSYLYPYEQTKKFRTSQLCSLYDFECICPSCLASPDGNETSEILELKLIPLERMLLERESEAEFVLEGALHLLTEAIDSIDPSHFILSRIHKLVSNSCEVLLKSKCSKHHRAYAVLFLSSCLELLKIQNCFLGKDHIELASTWYDISLGIQRILSYDKQILYDEFPQWNTFRKASYFENDCRKEYSRILSLYEQ